MHNYAKLKVHTPIVSPVWSRLKPKISWILVSLVLQVSRQNSSVG